MAELSLANVAYSWEKKGEDWVYTAYSDLAEIVNLSQIDLSFPLTDIYENVIFQVNS